MIMAIKQKLKELLKRFYPIPARSFMREIDRVIASQLEVKEQLASVVERQAEALLQESKNMQSALKKEIEILLQEEVQLPLKAEMHASLQKEVKSVMEREEEILKRLCSLEELVCRESLHAANTTSARLSEEVKVIFYTSLIEKRFCEKNFNLDVFTASDFEQRVVRLIRGLDRDSIETVGRILSRLPLILKQTGEEIQMNILTEEEQKATRQYREHFVKPIIKISDSLYCSRGYFLPVNHFEYPVFGEQHCIRFLYDISSIRKKHIIDAGAYIGDSALILSPLTDMKVHSFEAVPQNYENMQKTIELNALKNVVPVNCALTAPGRSKITIHVGDSESTSSTVENGGFSYKDQLEVKAISLDEYVAENQLEVGLIKVDIEGAEQDFLKGAMRTIKEQKPALLLSIYHNSSDFFDIKPMLEELELGYEFKIYRPNMNIILIETVLIAQVPQS